MLVVVEDGDVAAFLQAAFDLEAAGRRDVLQIDAAEAARQKRHRVDDLVHVLAAYAQGDGVHAAEPLEQDALSLHDGHARLGSDVPQSQDCGPVRDDRHQIAPAGEFIALCRILLDGQTRSRHPGSIGQGQVVLRLDRHLRAVYDLALPFAVQAKRFFRVIHVLLPHRAAGRRSFHARHCTPFPVI